MANPIIIKRFKEIGLSAYEAKSYLSLLERRTLTVSEIAKLATIPRTNAYEALESLLAKGYCVSKPGKVKQYSAVDPVLLKEKAVAVLDQAFESRLSELYAKQDEILAEKKSARERLAELSDELAPLYKKCQFHENPMNYIEIIKDPFQIHRRFMELVSNAKKEILGFSKPPYSAGRELAKEEMEQQADLCERQVVELKSIHEIPKSKDEIRLKLEDLIRTTKGSDETRVIGELPMKMAVIDERFVMLALEDPVSHGSSFTTQVVEHPSLAKGLRILFFTLWEQADDYHVLEKFL